MRCDVGGGEGRRELGGGKPGGTWQHLATRPNSRPLQTLHRTPRSPTQRPPLVDEREVAAAQLRLVALALHAAQGLDLCHHAQQVNCHLLDQQPTQVIPGGEGGEEGREGGKGGREASGSRSVRVCVRVCMRDGGSTGGRSVAAQLRGPPPPRRPPCAADHRRSRHRLPHPLLPPHTPRQLHSRGSTPLPTPLPTFLSTKAASWLMGTNSSLACILLTSMSSAAGRRERGHGVGGAPGVERMGCRRCCCCCRTSQHSPTQGLLQSPRESPRPSICSSGGDTSSTTATAAAAQAAAAAATLAEAGGGGAPQASSSAAVSKLSA